MISGISSAVVTPTASIMYGQQIQALDSQATRLESQITSLQETIVSTQQNERMSNEEKRERISSINEQISEIRERISEIRVKTSELRYKQIKAENEARRRQQAADERSQQARPEQENEIVDRSLVHAISSIDIRSDGLNGAKTQLNSRLNEANREDIWRSDSHGRMELIPLEDRRPNNPEEAQKMQQRLNDIETSALRENIGKATELKKAVEKASQSDQSDKLSTLDEEPYEGNHDGRFASGTGRMEIGQYLESKA